MKYELKNGKVLTSGIIKYAVAYHCNLRCSGCTHLAPYSRKYFPSLESFTADVNRLGKGLHASVIELLGGEPLLNPEINSYIKAAKESGIAETVRVTTNGLLLHKMNDEFWRDVDVVSVTMYPDALPQEKFIPMFKKRAEESNTRLYLRSRPQFRAVIVTEPHPHDWITTMIFRTCKDPACYHYHMIHEGKLYKCGTPAFLKDYLSKMGRNDYDPLVDSFDIHSSRDIYRDVKEFLISGTAIDACRFCLGYVGKSQEHHQLGSEHIADPGLQNIRRSTHLDTYRFLVRCALYYQQLALEKIKGAA